MRTFLARRILTVIVTLFVTSMVVFALARIQGDPRAVLLSDYTTNEQWDAWGERLGLNKPLYVQYFLYLKTLLKGDLGESTVQRKSVASLLPQRIINTAQLAAAAFTFTVVVGIPLGVLAATKRGGPWDYSARFLAIFGHAAPSFWVGLLLILVFAVRLDIVPTSRKTELSSIILPTFALGIGALGAMVRLVRSSMLEVLGSEYVKLAVAKGVPRWRVVWSHAMRNALIAPLTYAGLLLAGLITGTVVTESVFAWPGLGLLAIQAVRTADYPVMQGVLLFGTLAFVSINLFVDILYAFADPRIRYG